MTAARLGEVGKKQKAESLFLPWLGENIEELMESLSAHFEKVKADAAFLALKQSELRPGDQISLFGFMDVQEQLRLEQSLLAGHAFMIQEELSRRHCATDAKTRRCLAEILNQGMGGLCAV